MPLWLIFHPPSTFTTPASRSALAASLTSVYTASGLPAFYVVVNFIPLSPTTDTFIGGVPAAAAGRSASPARPFIRLVGEHIAIRLPGSDDDAYRRTTARIDAALKPHIADQGYDWEYHVDETERRLWKINGFVPPKWGGEGERLWARENRAVPYEDEDGEEGEDGKGKGSD